MSTMPPDLTIDFIIVEESEGVLKPKPRIKLQLPRFKLFWFQATTSALIFENMCIPLSTEDKQDLLVAMSRRALSMPPESDHLFVCILTKTPNDEEESGSISYEFNITTGIHVDDDEAISWDLGQLYPFNEVLLACKPPIPSLRKTKIIQQKEDLSCPICLQEFSVGSEAARTTCSHLYHCECIVVWLTKSTSCPICRCRLHVA